MKKLFHYTIFLFCISVITACSKEDKEIINQLEYAEHLLYSAPDSALNFLNTLKSAGIFKNSKSKMKSELIAALAQNSADIPFTSDTTVLKIVDYFDKHGNRNEQMRANYALGCVYRDLHDAPMAIRYYNIAANKADTTHTDCDFRTLSRIYGQMATVFHDQRSPELELKYEQKAVDAAWLANDTLAAVLFYSGLAEPYSLLQNDDSVLVISENSYHILRELGYMELAAQSLNRAIQIHLLREEYDKVIEQIQLYEKYSGLIDQYGNISKGNEFFYSYRGRYYEGTNNLDSAEIYFNKLLPYANQNNCALAAYRGLSSIYKKRGNDKEALRYASLYANVQSRAAMERATEETIKAQAMYDYQQILNQKENVEHSKNIFKYALILGFVTAILVFLELSKRNKKIKVELRSSENKHKKYKNKKEKEITELQKTISSYEEISSKIESWNNELDVKRINLVSILHSKASRGQAATTTELNELVEYSQAYYKSYTNALAEGKLSATETNMCILLKNGFDSTEIIVLMDLSRQRSSNLRHNINLKLFKEDSTKNFEYNLKKL